MRAKDLAMMHLTPTTLRAPTACSRDEPQPQFLPATMMSPGRTALANVASRSSSACWPHSLGSVKVYVYLPGKITSVLTPSPYFQTRPWSCIGSFRQADNFDATN